MLPCYWPDVHGDKTPKRISILSEEVEPGCRRNLARIMRISKSSFYSPPTKQSRSDEASVAELKERHSGNPYYGVRRLALDLHWSIGKTRRIRNLANIKALRRSKKHRSVSGNQEISAPVNELKQFWFYKNPERPQDGYVFANFSNPDIRVWVQDFTYIWYKGSFYYLAAILNLTTREVVGWALGRYHNADLICDALLSALAYHNPPRIIHNDRGTEYLSEKHVKLCRAFGIKMSASAPGSPWQNGFMERFFATFKDECSTKISAANDVGELYELIANWIHYYNHNRIHTSLKMPPTIFAQKFSTKKKEAKKKS